MDFELKTLTLAQAAAQRTDLLVVLVPKASLGGADPLARLIAQAVQGGDLDPKPGQVLHLWKCEAVRATRLVLAGCGEADARAVRQAVAAALGATRSGPARRALVCLPPAADGAALRAAVLAADEACYTYTETKPSAQRARLARVTLATAAADAALQQAFARAQATALGVALAREWGNRPANHATPTDLATAARALGRAPGMACTVRGLAEIRRLGMGAFLAVAQGSAQPPRFIELRYNGGPRGAAPLVLVGKGITFDTGGISIKPAAEMDEMKFDMCGAASVLGVFRALQALRPACNVVGLIPATENMPGGRAVKPGDVVTTLSGQTVEILNTDAEGRLILCDALAYAARLKPAALVDIATLTGACVIALGAVRSGLFSSDDALAAELAEAGRRAGDPCWRMPLDDEYAEGLKSNFADMANVAGRAAGSVTAAKFLQKFVGNLPWAHLDIAGTAWKSGAAKGATGRPVALLMEWISTRAGDGQARRPSRRRAPVASRDAAAGAGRAAA